MFTKTSGKPDDLLLLFESSKPRCSFTQAKKKAEIAGRGNYFFDSGRQGLDKRKNADGKFLTLADAEAWSSGFSLQFV